MILITNQKINLNMTLSNVETDPQIFGLTHEIQCSPNTLNNHYLILCILEKLD